jgi:hypothetical protein
VDDDKSVENLDHKGSGENSFVVHNGAKVEPQNHDLYGENNKSYFGKEKHE